MNDNLLIKKLIKMESIKKDITALIDEVKCNENIEPSVVEKKISKIVNRMLRNHNNIKLEPYFMWHFLTDICCLINAGNMKKGIIKILLSYGTTMESIIETKRKDRKRKKIRNYGIQ